MNQDMNCITTAAANPQAAIPLSDQRARLGVDNGCSNAADRRHFVRFTTPPMYHAVSVRRLAAAADESCRAGGAAHDDDADDRTVLDGHAYDLSMGGAQIELDEVLEPGTNVSMMLHLPAGFDDDDDARSGSASRREPRDIAVTGRIIRLADIDDPGPVRMALAFTAFTRAVDEARLNRYLKRRSLRRAAA